MNEEKSFNDPFTIGRWMDWLRAFKEGEEQTKEVDFNRLPSIRASISKLADSGYYFKTITNQTQLWVKRLSLEEWLQQPRRRPW